ncbi:Hypothetical predicted protein [Cloeon dipterum]|nr:Hypothetical predicted protein [Cloeon dipterum]
MKVQKDVVTDDWNSQAIALMVLGGTIFTISFLGCCGAIGESKCMLYTFGSILMVIFILQTIIAILLLTSKDKISKHLNEEVFGKAIAENKENEVVINIQTNLKCCGIVGPGDWKNATISCNHSQPEAGGEAGNRYTEGCGEKIEELVSKYSNNVAAGAMVTAAMEVIGALLAFYVARKLHSGNIV